jgi:general secretion pathway protein C
MTLNLRSTLQQARTHLPANVAVFRVVILLALVVLIVIVARPFWPLISGVPEPVSETVKPAPVQVVPRAREQTLATPGGLSGTSDVPVAMPEAHQEAPDTPLNLTLRGVLAADDTHEGFAIIQNADKDEWYFKAGDGVFGLATLDEIYVDRVILVHNGRYETLHLPLESAGVVIDRDKIVSKREQGIILHDYRKAILEGDYMTFVGMVDYETAYDSSGFVGFRLLAESEQGKEMLAKLGLEHNDLIVSVDGVRLNESLETVKEVSKFESATRMTVGIERNNAPLTFSFEIPPDHATDNPVSVED